LYISKNEAAQASESTLDWRADLGFQLKLDFSREVILILWVSVASSVKIKTRNSDNIFPLPGSC
jgi:hypothetical protein